MKLKYKGFTGTVEYSKEDKCFFGIIENISSKISYEGQEIQELTNDFHNAVNEYLEDL